MSPPDCLEIAVFLAVLLALVSPLGAFMGRVFEGRPCGLDRVLSPVESLLYRAAGVRAEAEMGWKEYTLAALAFNLVGFGAVYLLQRCQGFLPLDPAGLGAVSPDSAFNTAVSFATNTNWQGYSGETTMSYLTQALGLAVQNFVSAASGIAVLAALARGLARRRNETIGNFWRDLVRSTLYVFLPLSVVLALLLVSQGAVQTLDGPVTATLLDPVDGATGAAAAERSITLGPAASQIAIKQLGTNGGGFFNANSAHPFENPTPLSDFVEKLAILLVAAASCDMFGRMVGDRRQGLALLAPMLLLFVPAVVGTVIAEAGGNPALEPLGVDQEASRLQDGGNMEGKEVRHGIASSALWAVATTAASNGSVNSMHDSYTPLGSLAPMVLMQLGEVVFGGVGSGLYGMIFFALVAVFVAGLMVGRTPEYLGKKIEAFEMKMASIGILAPCLAVLLGTAIAVASDAGRKGVQDPGPHGFSEVLYAFSSAGNNNGSAFAGLAANTPFYNLALGLAMLVARYLPLVAATAVAGSLARKKIAPAGLGTLPTHGPLFVALLASVVVLVSALTFFPALALGPIVEHLRLP